MLYTALCNRFYAFTLKLELPLILECKVIKPDVVASLPLYDGAIIFIARFFSDIKHFLVI